MSFRGKYNYLVNTTNYSGYPGKDFSKHSLDALILVSNQSY